MVISMEKKQFFKKEDISEKITEFLNKYYFQKGSISSTMHSILGPFNVMYNEYRKTTTLDYSTAKAIAGKVYRQLEMLTSKEGGLFSASELIFEICLSINEILKKMNLREKKRYLNDLRYSIYLLRVLSINEKIKKKRQKKEEKE